MIYTFKVTHSYLQMYLKILETCLNIYEIDPVYFVSAPGLAWQPCLKKTGAKLELITYYDMILMIEKVLGIENYKIRLIHVFILFLTFRPLLKALSSCCKYFLQTELS